MKMKMKMFIWITVVLTCLVLTGAWYTNSTNPYATNSSISVFFNTSRTDKNGQIILTQSNKIYFWNTPFARVIMYMQAFFRIGGNAQLSERPFSGSVQDIITKIHVERFDPTKPYVISGGHFAELYPRNFGIFYSAILDNRIPSSKQDWENRQRVTLQTVATDLALLASAKKEYTTFVPVSTNTFVGVNIYTKPSDSLFAVLYTLSALTDDTFIQNNFPAIAAPLYPLQTQQAGKQLLINYKPILRQAIADYFSEIIDPESSLIKKDITLSSARDGIKRESSFYDNVIAWDTARLAQQLGIIALPTNKLQEWKQHIIAAFWDEKAGIFLDDLSPESKKDQLFSGDAFIVTSAQFLDIKNSNDKAKIIRMISYVQNNQLDKPFPLHYAVANQVDKLYLPVRLFATSYMGDSIWSHWGIEYIKTLLLLAPDNSQYLAAATNGLTAYTKSITSYGGYPELYNKNGTIFKTPFYKSVLHTGWIINYEQAIMMLHSQQDRKQ